MDITRFTAGALASGAAVAVAATLAPVAHGATPNRFECSSEALTSSLSRQSPLLPLGAGAADGPCGNDVGGGEGAGRATAPGTLGLDGAYALTAIGPSANVAPAYQTARAASGVADARLDPSGATLRVQGVQAESAVSCAGATPRFTSTGRVAKLFVLGQEVPLNDGATRLITAADGVTQVLVHIRLNQETRDASGYTFRALRVTAPMDGSLLDVSAGVNRLGTSGAPCADFTGTDPGPDAPGDRPVEGLPYGGGNVFRLTDLPGYASLKASLCVRAKRYGRRIGIAGNNRRNNITGSKFADRIFGYGSRDRLNGGAGTDCIEAGSGSDIVNGGTAGDAIFGRSGNDYLDGGAGNDRINGGPGKDLIATATGRDRVNGASGNDHIVSRDGRDVIQGGSGRDRISAANGGRRDRISCGSGRDVARVDPVDRVSKTCERVIVVRGRNTRR